MIQSKNYYLDNRESSAYLSKRTVYVFTYMRLLIIKKFYHFLRVCVLSVSGVECDPGSSRCLVSIAKPQTDDHVRV